MPQDPKKFNLLLLTKLRKYVKYFELPLELANGHNFEKSNNKENIIY